VEAAPSQAPALMQAASSQPPAPMEPVPSAPAGCKRPGRKAWVQKILQAQSRRAPEELDVVRERMETARQHEAAARKCKAVKGLAVRSRALCAEGLRQMAVVEASEDYAVVQDRWRSAQEVSRARQKKKCKRLGRERLRRRRSRSRCRSGSLGSAGSRLRCRWSRSHCRSDSSGSASSDACLLRCASDSEESAMAEAAGLVGASDAVAMAATGAEGLDGAAAPASPTLWGHQRHDDFLSDSASDAESFEGPPAAVGATPDGGNMGMVNALLQQLKQEPDDAVECAAKFKLYEGYAVEVESMRSALLQFYGESTSALPPAIVTDMDQQVQSIDCEAAMQIPDRSQEWFVYHMMCQAERNNLRMGRILDNMEKKLKFIVANEQAECPVCLDAFGEGSRVPETLGCCHKVCRECWHHWSRVVGSRPFCPLCRHKDFLGAVAECASRGSGDVSETDTE